MALEDDALRVHGARARRVWVVDCTVNEADSVVVVERIIREPRNWFYLGDAAALSCADVRA